MRKKLGLSGKLVLMILFSALASAVFLVGMQVVLNKALWLYFDQPETQQKAVEKQVQELQSYIDRRGLSSRDIDKLDDWSVRNGSTMFIIYDRSRMLYSSYPLVAPVYEGRENVTETVPAEHGLPMYSLTFSDKKTTAMFYYNGVDAYYGKGCEILLLVSFALFPLFFFLSSRKIIRYILLLSGEIQAMEGGDLDHPITIQGDDELALLATSLDGLRLTLRQQQAEEAQAAAKVKSLITEMSHDLRTPLTSISGAASVLLSSPEVSPQNVAMLRDIKNDADSLIIMVENLLSITRIQDGNIPLKKHEEMLEEVAGDAILTTRRRFPDCHVELDLSEDILYFPMEPMLVKQVMVNLLENAIRHSGDTQHITLHLFRQDDWAVVEVRDRGKGLSPEICQAVQAGKQLDKKLSGDTSRGMGIGLSVCQSIIKAHGGFFAAGNNPEGGAVFRFGLPMEETNHA